MVVLVGDGLFGLAWPGGGGFCDEAAIYMGLGGYGGDGVFAGRVAWMRGCGGGG